MKSIWFVVVPGGILMLAGLCGAMVWAADPAAVVPTTHDPGLHLLVDPEVVLETSGTTRIVNQAERLPEPIVVSSWLPHRMATAWGNVLREANGKFRMWYLDMHANPHDMGKRGVWGREADYGFHPQKEGDCSDIECQCICYAESDDGIHWTKPNLGLVEFLGTKDNNVVMWGGYGAEKTNRGVTNMDGCTVIRDDEEPDPRNRYKMLAYWETVHLYDRDIHMANRSDGDMAKFRQSAGRYVCFSADGIHWHGWERFQRSGSDRMLVIRDRRNNQWWLSDRPHVPGTPEAPFIRGGGLIYSKDLVNWSPNDPVLIPDPARAAVIQYHTFMPFNYGNQDLGFLSVMNIQGGGIQPFLVGHCDGQKWRQLAPETPIIAHGPSGSFDRLNTIPTHNEPIIVGDRMFIYYSAGSATSDNPAGVRSIGLARLRRDAFIGYAAGVVNPKSNLDVEGEATLTTKPFRVDGKALSLNFEKLVDQGRVRVAVLRPDRTSIPGYSLDDCQPVAKDGIRMPVQWKEKTDLADLVGQEVILDFRFVHGVLYAFHLADGD